MKDKLHEAIRHLQTATELIRQVAENKQAVKYHSFNLRRMAIRIEEMATGEGGSPFTISLEEIIKDCSSRESASADRSAVTL